MLARTKGEIGMTRAILLKRVEGFELWSSVCGAVEHFLVRTEHRRARVLHSLEAAEAFLAKRLLHARAVRSN